MKFVYVVLAVIFSSSCSIGVVKEVAPAANEDLFEYTKRVAYDMNDNGKIVAKLRTSSTQREDYRFIRAWLSTIHRDSDNSGTIYRDAIIENYTTYCSQNTSGMPSINKVGLFNQPSVLFCNDGNSPLFIVITSKDLEYTKSNAWHLLIGQPDRTMNQEEVKAMARGMLGIK